MNLNIEGTKHEKAVLVILSYVVGFTAGFITFGVTSSNGFAKHNTVMSGPPVMNETVVPPMESPTEVNEVMEEMPVETTSTDQVMYQNGRLMANVNGASVLLSAQLATVDRESAKTFASQGVHEAIPNYVASDNGVYIYYCEQHSQADSCANFVYDVNAGVIHYVTLDGVKLVTTGAVADTATWNNSSLMIDGASSISAETPWKLTKSN